MNISRLARAICLAAFFAAGVPAIAPAIAGGAPVIVQGPAPRVVVAGSPVTFACMATGATTYQWTRDGQPIPGADAAQYTLARAGLNDSGCYRVLVGDGAAPVVSAPASLLVTQPWSDPAIFIYDFNARPPENPKQPLRDLAGGAVAVLVHAPPPALVPGPAPLGGGWDFGKTDAAVVVKSSPALKAAGDVTKSTGFSLAVWLAGKPVRRNVRLMNCGGTLDANSIGNGFSFDIGDSATMVPITLDTPDGMMDDRWHHVVVTIDFTTSTDNVAMYVDAKRVTTLSRSIDQSFIPNGDFAIGARSSYDGQSHIKIAQVAMFAKGLVAAEVSALYRTGSLRTYAPSVIARANSDRVVLPNRRLALLGSVTSRGASPRATWSKVSGPGKVEFADANSASTIATFSAKGTYVLRLTGGGDGQHGDGEQGNGADAGIHGGDGGAGIGGDGGAGVGESALMQWRDVTVRVVENQPPVAMASTNTPAVCRLPATISLTGGALDDGLPENPGRVSFHWAQVGGPGTATIASPDDEVTTAALPASGPGDYVFRLTADDGALTNSTDVRVSVVADLAPTVWAFCTRPIIDFRDGGSNQFGLTCRATGNGPSANSGKLSYAWSEVNGPSKLVFDDAASPTPKASVAAPGVYQARATVSDGALSASADVWLKAVPARVSAYVTSPDYVRPFSPNPAPFVHPRLFFTEQDRPELAEKARRDPLVAAAVAQMRQGISRTLDDPKTRLGRAYARLARGDSGVDFRSLYPDVKAGATMTGTGEDFYSELSAACYLAWLDQTGLDQSGVNPSGQIPSGQIPSGQIPSGLSQSGPDQSVAKKLRELAKVVATLARCHAAAYTPAPERRADDHGGLSHDVFSDLGFCYDLTYNWMTEDERFTTRALLSAMTTSRHTIMWNSRDSDISTNWRNGHDHLILAALAIEGEPGFDAGCTAQNIEALKIYVTKWGLNDQGFNREGPGYFSLGMHAGALAAYAVSRRGENLFVTGNLYQCTLEMFYCMSPDTNSMWGHGDAEGWNNGSGVAAAYDVFKAVYPKDELTDFVYRNALKEPSYQKNFPLARAIFGHDPLPGNNTPAIASAAKGLSLDVFSPQRGLAIARSDWSPGGVRVDFDDRFDCFDIGHMKTNRDSFYLYSHGRSWITDAGYHSVHNDLHSTVLIDGLGEAGTSTRPRWPSLPGHFLEHISTPDFALFAGDARAAYTYEWGGTKNGTSSYGNEEHGVPTPYRWRDFFPAGFEPPPAMHGGDEWFGDFMHADADLYNPVQRAFRTVILARGATPYVLTLDDIQKDNAPRAYVWSANTNEGQGDMEIEPGASAADAVFRRQIDSAPKTPRLLVHVIEARGDAAPVALDTSTVGDVATRRIVIRRSDVIAPDFKVLLYPHLDGDALPTTTLAGDTLTVAFPGGSRDAWRLAVQPDGRTRVISFVRNGGAAPTISQPNLAPVPASGATTDGEASAIVNFAPSAVDSAGATIPVVCDPPSGSNFREGQTPVVATATDSAGRVSTTTFVVTVR